MTTDPPGPARYVSPPEVVPLRAEHLPDAAGLFAAGYQAAREPEPSLPSCHEDAAAILPKLRNLARKQSGVAAIRDGRMVGFLLGKVLPTFRGKRSVYSPEWAHAAKPEARREIYRNMYAGLSRHWVADGCFRHLITILAGQCEAVDAYFWLGFALTAVDATRDLSPVRGPVTPVDIRRAALDDTEAVMGLLGALERHLAAGPIFLHRIEKVERESVEQRLADPDRPSWLAYRGREPMAYVHIQSANPSAAYVISDAKTASIKAAFTKADCRRSGVGAALLNRAMEWARSAGYERCAVDFEPQNIPGGRFWLKHFRPVCYSMIRHIDERTAWARPPPARTKEHA